jgi:hypothetical protein
MAYISELTAGSTYTMTQNVVYGIPSRVVFIHSSAVLQTSLDNSSYSDLAATTTGTQLVDPFVKCTTGNAIVAVKVY